MLNRFVQSSQRYTEDWSATHWTRCYRMTRFHTGMVGTIELTPTGSATRRGYGQMARPIDRFMFSQASYWYRDLEIAKNRLY